jgi:hypothetical protein
MSPPQIAQLPRGTTTTTTKEQYYGDVTAQTTYETKN